MFHYPSIIFEGLTFGQCVKSTFVVLQTEIVGLLRVASAHSNTILDLQTYAMNQWMNWMGEWINQLNGWMNASLATVLT